MAQLVLALCGGENVPFGFLAQYTPLHFPEPLPLIAVQGLYISQNRNKAINEALKLEDWTHLLFVDPDMTFPSRMRQHIEKEWRDPIVGGLYFKRKYPDFGAIPGNLTGEGPAYEPFNGDDFDRMLDEPGLYRSDVLGTGCMAIRRDVLENWANELMPWFQVVNSVEGDDVITEDVNFCWRAKQQGIQPMLDTRVRCGHLATMPVGVNTYRQVVK